jgi:NTE family protein
MSQINRLLRSARAFRNALTREPQIFAASPAPRIGLALGGGFARGIAHIGVLKVLEEENIPISYVAGTSVGALIGAIYCSGVSAAELVDVAKAVRFRDFAGWTLSRLGFATTARMMRLLNRVLKVKTFEELRIPFGATDLLSGDAVFFREGPLVDPVRASCAYPGMFLPVEINNRIYVDGMLAHPIPAEPLRQMGATHVLAVHLRASCAKVPHRHIFEVIGQCFAIAQFRTVATWRPFTDAVVEPDVSAYAYNDFLHWSELIHIGEQAMREVLPEIKQWIAGTVTDATAARLVPQPQAKALPEPSSAIIPVK